MVFKGFVYYWLPPIIWMLFISPVNELLTFESSSSILFPLLRWLFPYAGRETLEIIHLAVRKLSHFLEYALLAFLLFRGFRGNRKIMQWKWIFYVALISVGYAAFDEFVQAIIPSRTGSVYDWIIDSAGVACMLTVIYLKAIVVKPFTVSSKNN